MILTSSFQDKYRQINKSISKIKITKFNKNVRPWIFPKLDNEIISLYNLMLYFYQSIFPFALNIVFNHSISIKYN